jgi:hypothetical protein
MIYEIKSYLQIHIGGQRESILYRESIADRPFDHMTTDIRYIETLIQREKKKKTFRTESSAILRRVMKCRIMHSFNSLHSTNRSMFGYLCVHILFEGVQEV